MLPEFLILGAPKSGTTSLAETLARHPQLFVPERKEPSFFDVNWDKGLPWFEQHFTAASAGQLRGEATPEYFATPVAAERIHRVNPGCKLIVLARDPIKRAHSHYWFRRNTGRETRSFDEVIDEETSSPEALAAGYLLRHGLYAANLATYRKHFPREQLHLRLFEDMIADSRRGVAECLAFLGVDDQSLSLDHANAARAPYSLAISRAIQAVARYDGAPKRVLRRLVGERPRKQLRGWLLRVTSKEEKNPSLPATTRARLAAFYADDTAQLQRELGRASLWG